MNIPACYERIEPPDPDYECTVECPNCGAELHEGDVVYERRVKRKQFPTYEIFACEHCIEDMAIYVEDL